MYNTPNGLRVLRGAERRLVVESLVMISDSLALDDFVLDIPIIEDLTRNQKIVMYHAAARVLLNKKAPPPPATAVLDATVASVYRLAREMIFMELDDEGLILTTARYRRGLAGANWRLPPVGRWDSTMCQAWTSGILTIGTCCSPVWNAKYLGTTTGKWSSTLTRRQRWLVTSSVNWGSGRITSS